VIARRRSHRKAAAPLLPARSRSGLGAGDMLAATTKQDCRDSRSPRARPLIAVGTLLVYAWRDSGFVDAVVTAACKV
jgi:hypothetical protein